MPEVKVNIGKLKGQTIRMAFKGGRDAAAETCKKFAAKNPYPKTEEPEETAKDEENDS